MSLTTGRAAGLYWLPLAFISAKSCASRCRGAAGRHVCAAAAASTAAGGRRQGVAEIQADSRDKVDVNPPKGTRDFPPEEMRVRNWLFGHFREVSKRFGFEEFDAPVLESEALYVRKAGEEITEQLYCFEDKGGRRVALRPELTPSLARIILGKGKSLPLPAKWFAVGQCWRYERMTRGRRREHYQWNMDVFGVPGVEAEAELLAAVVDIFRSVGLSERDVGIKVSSRKVLQAVAAQCGVPADKFGAVCVVVDKVDKLPREAVVAQLKEVGCDDEAVEGILGALTIASIDALREILGSDAEPVQELGRLFELAEGYGYRDWLVLDTSVVRGLAYYTGTVFEGFDRAGQLRAICGGGRYDRILSTFGGEDLPAAGFGFGDAVIMELLADRGLVPQLAPEVQDVVLCLDEDVRPVACRVASSLRAKGRAVDLVLEGKKLKWVFKHTERLQAERLISVGKAEAGQGAVVVRDLATRADQTVPIADL